MTVNWDGFSRKVRGIRPGDDLTFGRLALELYRYQRASNPIYKALSEGPTPLTWDAIPCMPISLFKHYDVRSFEGESEVTFQSSGTTQSVRSKHSMKTTDLYRDVIGKLWREYWGSNTVVHPVGPASASLTMMQEELMSPESLRLFDFEDNSVVQFVKGLTDPEDNFEHVLFGTTLALFELARVMERLDLRLDNVVVVETGGAKGRDFGLTPYGITSYLYTNIIGRDLEEDQKLSVPPQIFGEYSMSELSSQLYGSFGHYSLESCSTMRVRVVNPYNNQSVPEGQSGVIQFYDLANIWSCPFIQTEDMGHIEKGFLVLEGRVQGAEEKGCSLSTAQAIDRVEK